MRTICAGRSRCNARRAVVCSSVVQKSGLVHLGDAGKAVARVGEVSGPLKAGPPSGNFARSGTIIAQSGQPSLTAMVVTVLMPSAPSQV